MWQSRRFCGERRRMDTVIFAIILAAVAIAAAVIILLTRAGRAPPDAVDLPPSDLATVSAEALIDPVATIPAEAVAPPFAPADDAPAGPPDDLTRIKGLGSKAATRLNELGITRYDQLARLSGVGLAAIAAEMGAFEGRIARDRWIEQAGHLAAGDTAGFEAKFGKLGD